MTDDHPQYRLGRKRPDPAHAARALRIGDYLTRPKQGITPPPANDHFAKITDWGMYDNDQFGVCGPTGTANERKLVTKYLTGEEISPSQDDVFALYKLQNPQFDPATDADDNGVDIQTMCEELIASGIGDTKALAFASVNVRNKAEVRECITLFGALLLGVSLDVAQQQQTDGGGPWTYVTGSGEWGGHCVLLGKYDPQYWSVITWAEVIEADESFWNNQVEEAFVVIWPEMMGIPAFQAGIDLQQLAADYRQLTGRTFPEMTTPTPAPAPADHAESLAKRLEGDVSGFLDRVKSEAENEWKPELEGLKADITALDAGLRPLATQILSLLDEFLASHGHPGETAVDPEPDGPAEHTV
jgi:hypothetical protein